jgi:hypothetical protein
MFLQATYQKESETFDSWLSVDDRLFGEEKFVVDIVLMHNL